MTGFAFCRKDAYCTRPEGHEGRCGKSNADEVRASWRLEFWERLDELEKRFGKGPTYGLRDRQLILARIVPEWIFRAAYAGPTKEVRDRAARAALALEHLHAEAFTEYLEQLREEP